jgi:hypothetical protein
VTAETPSGRRTVRGLGGGSQAQRRVLAPLDPGGHGEEAADRDELYERERRREREVQELGGLTVDLRLERRVPRTAEDEDDAERREGEEEHDRARGRDGRSQRRQRDGLERAPLAGSEDARRLLLVRIEMRPEPAHGADDHRVVEEHVRDENRPHGLIEAQAAERPVRSEHRCERRADDHRGEHEGNGHERAHDASAREVVAREHVRAGERDRHREHRRDRRLPDGEPDHVTQRRVGHDFAERVEVETTITGRQAACDDRRDRVDEEEREERDRDEREEHAGPVPARAEH